MDSAKDISKKIRTAIKAKLVELGAYVDDELPDYIMVMVANKKSQSQMTEDLNLFLAHNTEKFTSWLHGLLVKLQTLSSDQQKGKEDHSISENSLTKEPKQSEKKSPADKQQQKTAKPVEKDSKTSNKTAIKRKSSESKSKIAKDNENQVVETKSKEKKDQVKPSVSSSKQKDEEYVSELLETVETNEFSEEFNTEQEPTQKQGVTKAVKHVAPTTIKKPEGSCQKTQTVKPQPATMIPTRDLSYPQTMKKKVISKKVKKVIKKAANSSTTKTGTATITKKKPSSIVGTVKQKYTELPEEEYDPLNPSFGKLASAVKVNRKRLSVPPSQQANKALILKATAEAEKSVSSALHNVLKEEKLYSAREKAAVKPIQRKVPELRHPKIKPNIELISKSRREEMMRQMTYTIDNDDSQESKQPENMKIVVQNRLKSGKILEPSLPESLTYTVTNKPQTVKHDVEGLSYSNKPKNIQYITSPETVQYAVSQTPQTVHLVSSVPAGLIPQPQKVQYLTRLSAGEMTYTDANEPQFVQYVKVEPQQVEMETVQTSLPSDNRKFQHVARVQPVMDSRLVKRKSLDEDEEEEEMEEVSEEEEEVEMLPDLEESDETGNEEMSESPDAEIQEALREEDDSLSLELEEKTPEPSPEPELVQPDPEPVQQKRFIKERLPQQSKHKESQVNPKFIVTLDGVDPMKFKTSSFSEEPEWPKQEVKVISKLSPPAIKPITINFKDTDDEDEEFEESQSKKSKMTEKCKFWPACVNGNSCSYHHPTTPCKMFPNCKFGDKCLYIHPNCKFDAKCTKKDCPFTHASKRGNAPTVIKQYIPMPVPQAPTYHHRPQTKTPCKFGSSCQNVYCTFQHPANCRYGANCLNRASCPFTHPPAQPKDKYLWTANKSLDSNKPTAKTFTATLVTKPS